MSRSKRARLYRMVMPGHVCPYGLKAHDLLKRSGYAVQDEPLESRAETEAFKREHGVATTPQVFIDGRRIGGYEELREFLGKSVRDPDETSYRPVAVIFALAAAMAVAMSWAFAQTLSFRTIEWFVAVSMCLLALQKLQDLRSFSTMFLNYDLLARRWVPYAYVYPFAEGLAGILMIAGGVFGLTAAPISLFIGTFGAISVFKAVYVDKRELKCACVGGDSSVPLGFISLTENLMMMAMGLWMIAKASV